MECGLATIQKPQILQKRDPDAEGGTSIGYHSEAANIGSHSKRLHQDKDSLTEERAAEDENSTADL